LGGKVKVSVFLTVSPYIYLFLEVLGDWVIVSTQGIGVNDELLMVVMSENRAEKIGYRVLVKVWGDISNFQRTLWVRV